MGLHQCLSSDEEQQGEGGSPGTYDEKLQIRRDLNAVEQKTEQELGEKENPDI